MGNDGGSIARREDLVRTKAQAEKPDKRQRAHIAWRTCALSKLPLSPPVVADALGRLYNKDAVLEHMLRPGVYGADGALTAKHLRSIRDVVTLKLAERPEGERVENGDDEPVRFICPLTRRDMDGTVPFVYIRTCGCVLSLSGLRNAGPTGSMTNCPVCAEPAVAADVVTINPPDEEAKQMADAWEALCAADKAAKKARKASKRKSDAVDGLDQPTTREKKMRIPLEQAAAAPTAPKLPAVIAAATEAAQERAKKSAVVSSMYAKPKKYSDGDWLVRGTFNRFA